MRRNADLAITAAITVAAALVTGLISTASPGVAWLRVIAGVALVLVLPGYALTEFALPARSPRRFSLALWRCLWTVGLSLAVAVLGGLLLNLMPAGLTRVSWTILLSAVTLLALAVACGLRLRSSALVADERLPHAGTRPWPDREDTLLGSEREDTQPWPDREGTQPWPSAAGEGRRAPGWAVVGYALAALVVAGTATGLAVTSGGWQHSPPFAQLWLVPGTPSATLGVRSAYPEQHQFRLVLSQGTTSSQQTRLDSWDFTLGPGQTWRRPVAAPAGQRLTARLTTVGQPQSETVTLTTRGAE